MNIKLDDLFELKDGLELIQNRTFEDVCFDHFSIRTRDGIKTVLKDIVFKSCEVSPGTCRLMPGVNLLNVRFSNFKCGDAMHVASEAVLDGVVIDGAFPNALIVKPLFRGENGVGCESHQLGLDISDYEGEVNISCKSVGCVVTNPELQAKIKLALLDGFDWKSCGVSGVSYWKILARKISVEGGMEGVYSLPNKSSKNYNKAVHELQKLRAKGVFE